MTTFSGFNPVTGESIGTYRAATPDDVSRTARAASGAFAEFASLPGERRGAFLGAAADAIAGLGDELLAVASRETGLAATPRLAGERDRTVFQLRMFADMARDGSWAELVIDPANPTRAPLPKPDLRRVLRPLGPVAVFGASNFPLAYSVAGGDTASALASGCPVIVKGHPAHPGTGEMVARAVHDAAIRTGMPGGVFAFLHAGGDRDHAVGKELVTHPAIKAVGFTGSPAGGMALVRLAADRPEPIPVFAEMGSVNPVLVLPSALGSADQAAPLAEKLAASAVMSGGQMCTCPGLIFAVGGPAFEAFAAALSASFAKSSPVAMLSPRVREGFTRRLFEIGHAAGVMTLAGQNDQRTTLMPPITPTLLRTSSAAFVSTPTLAEECFGPAAILVECTDTADMLVALANVQGSLTGTLWCDPADADAPAALACLEARVGRIIFAGVPTGVEVSPAMVHGGPYPACNRPDTSAVGPLAIRRWCRPVCYQNVPTELLSASLSQGVR